MNPPGVGGTVATGYNPPAGSANISLYEKSVVDQLRKDQPFRFFDYTYATSTGFVVEHRFFTQANLAEARNYPGRYVPVSSGIVKNIIANNQAAKIEAVAAENTPMYHSSAVLGSGENVRPLTAEQSQQNLLYNTQYSQQPIFVARTAMTSRPEVNAFGSAFFLAASGIGFLSLGEQAIFAARTMTAGVSPATYVSGIGTDVKEAYETAPGPFLAGVAGAVLGGYVAGATIGEFRSSYSAYHSASKSMTVINMKPPDSTTGATWGEGKSIVTTKLGTGQTAITYGKYDVAVRTLKEGTVRSYGPVSEEAFESGTVITKVSQPRLWGLLPPKVTTITGTFGEYSTTSPGYGSPLTYTIRSYGGGSEIGSGLTRMVGSSTAQVARSAPGSVLYRMEATTWSKAAGTGMLRGLASIHGSSPSGTASVAVTQLVPAVHFANVAGFGDLSSNIAVRGIAIGTAESLFNKTKSEFTFSGNEATTRQTAITVFTFAGKEKVASGSLSLNAQIPVQTQKIGSVSQTAQVQTEKEATAIPNEPGQLFAFKFGTRTPGPVLFHSQIGIPEKKRKERLFGGRPQRIVKQGPSKVVARFGVFTDIFQSIKTGKLVKPPPQTPGVRRLVASKIYGPAAPFWNLGIKDIRGKRKK